MTLFRTVSGRMAIHHKLLAIYDIMTTEGKIKLSKI